MTDQEMQQAVLRELAQVPEVEPNEVHVFVRDGVVSLVGSVESYQTRQDAEMAARRVPGIKALVDDLDVEPPSPNERTDVDIARLVLRDLEEEPEVPADHIRVTVRDGWVTLEGEVDRPEQRKRAYAVARDVFGVKGVLDEVEVRPRPTPEKVRGRIEEALRRAAEQEAQGISVVITDSTVVLQGTVHSRYEREQAEQAALQTPGVTKVEDNIAVEQ